MILVPPSHTRASNLAAVGPLTVEPSTDYPDTKKLINAIAESAWRARVAIAAGTAEWILWRVGTMQDWSSPFYFVEAIWAGIIDQRYLQLWKPAGDEPNSPAGETMYEVNRLLRWVCKKIEDEPSVSRASYLVHLARRVLPDKKPLNRWLKLILKRLETLYPMLDYDSECRLSGPERDAMKPQWRGAPVPREALDPALDYKPEMADELLAAYLAKLDYNENPFLNAPETMLELGFEGTPYTYPAK